MEEKNVFKNINSYCPKCERAVLDDSFKQCEWCSFQFETIENPQRHAIKKNK